MMHLFQSVILQCNKTYSRSLALIGIKFLAINHLNLFRWLINHVPWHRFYRRLAKGLFSRRVAHYAFSLLRLRVIFDLLLPTHVLVNFGIKVSLTFGVCRDSSILGHWLT